MRSQFFGVLRWTCVVISGVLSVWAARIVIFVNVALLSYVKLSGNHPHDFAFVQG